MHFTNNSWTRIETAFYRQHRVYYRLVFGDRPRGKMETYKLMGAALYGKTMKGKKETFLRYCKNLRYDAFFVYSYDTAVIKLNWKHRTAQRLGRWSKTTSTHMNYAIRMLDMCYDFKEIK